MKRILLVSLSCAVLALAACGAGGAALGVERGITMLVVPARYSVMQVAFDITRRFPVVLVSYQGEASTDEPLLHAWNGSEWARITVEEYADAAFVQVPPSQAVLVGGDDLLPPVLATAVSGWCPKVMTVPTTETPDLLNALGKVFKFDGSDWRWFARRYNLTIENLNAERMQHSWYDRTSYTDEWTYRMARWRGRKVPPPAPESMEAAPVEPVAMEPVAVEPLPEELVPMEPEPEPMIEMDIEPGAMPPALEPEEWSERAVADEPPVK